MTQAQNPEDKKLKLRKAALDYHEFPVRGKISVTPTKQLSNQHDLALAYSPGVAAACEEIVNDAANSFRYTSRGNLVGVVTNGSAVLGLGNIGALAGKPVMEGKGVLFKKFAGIDVFDIEINESDPDKLIEIIASLEPTFGGINLEDIKAPECFYIERKLQERLNIPVFHDDQHGTAIVVAAALTNALQVTGKDITQVKLVASGAGAAALACLKLLVKMGVPREHIWVTDLAGVVYEGRTELMDEDKAQFAQPTDLRTLAQVIGGADIFLGLSAGGVLKQDMVKTMANNPIIFALANPTPEILPEDVHAVRNDAIIATGRTDYPNQVNNVLCFPYIFRGALDSGATKITDAMEIAAVNAIAELARAEQDESVAAAYAGSVLQFGPEYLIPKPFDNRLMMKIAPAVAKAAQESGVAQRPIKDLKAYAEELEKFVYQSGAFMRPVFAQARNSAPLKRIVYAEGEDKRVLRAVQVVVDERLARPILVGRPAFIQERIQLLGLRLKEGDDYEVLDIGNNPHHEDFWRTYHKLAERRGVTPTIAKVEMSRRLTLISCMMVAKGFADGLVCGTWNQFGVHQHYIDLVLGREEGVSTYGAMNILVLPNRQLSIIDTHVNYDPSAQELAEITQLAATELKRFGLVPKAALLSHSNFGGSNQPSALKMRQVLELLKQQAPDLEVDGEMHGDSALNENVRDMTMPNSTLSGQANLLVMPNIDAANISYNLLKSAIGNDITIGPILLGVKKPVCIVTPATTVRRIVNMTAYVVVKAQAQEES